MSRTQTVGRAPRHRHRSCNLARRRWGFRHFFHGEFICHNAPRAQSRPGSLSVLLCSSSISAFRLFPHHTSLEPVINFRAGRFARENRARPGPPRTSSVGRRRGGGRRLWRPHCRVRQRSMARFSPQPRGPRHICGGVEAEGLGSIFLISVSLVARRFPIVRHSSIRELRKLVPSAARGKVNNRL